MRLRAYIFEDNKALRDIISSILESRGYEVLAYREPLVCPAYLDRECPCPENHACGDIFITDKSMPRMTGLEFIENQLCHGCKAIEKNKAVISGVWTDAELEQAKRLGCKTFQKPFKTNEFQKWLDECEKGVDPNRKLSDLPLRSGGGSL
jgi:CheY-like chemotaxis protein